MISYRQHGIQIKHWEKIPWRHPLHINIQMKNRLRVPTSYPFHYEKKNRYRLSQV